ncbi:MAG TPA: hypothetical protein P5127_00110 [Oscillospiraceae bacterium]|jgi:hypothetical protein|nr:hypothetical protein [Oscillospiraceae bacterium]
MGRKKNRLPPFVAIMKEMLRSKAWQEIGHAARVAYIHLRAKCVTPNNHDEVTLSYKEMEKIMQRRSFARAIKELEQHGFIVKRQSGGLYRRRNFYTFTDAWKDVGR